ncbi:4564_t:CDS:2 [Ambispora gerdemannii]|uniref:4564_t:CDS:1 n=1 Tax=Ambispora gerdemannii TaxID=144530 RepID=A0A9N9FY46_9GLOM|nr:4564_t:CDS:2 [Ambispora gerdemannii]
MKLQSIVTFMTASLASVIYTQACFVFTKGSYVHTLGAPGGGCFGTDPGDIITESSTDPPKGVLYTFYSDFNCQGALFSGTGSNKFDPGLKISSVRITCPDGT